MESFTLFGNRTLPYILMDWMEQIVDCIDLWMKLCKVLKDLLRTTFPLSMCKRQMWHTWKNHNMTSYWCLIPKGCVLRWLCRIRVEAPITNDFKDCVSVFGGGHKRDYKVVGRTKARHEGCSGHLCHLNAWIWLHISQPRWHIWQHGGIYILQIHAKIQWNCASLHNIIFLLEHPRQILETLSLLLICKSSED